MTSPGAADAHLPAPKAWDIIRARTALQGVALLRTDPQDGPVRLLVEHDGIVRELRSLDDLEALIVSFAHA